MSCQISKGWPFVKMLNIVYKCNLESEYALWYECARILDMSGIDKVINMCEYALEYSRMSEMSENVWNRTSKELKG